MSLSLVSNQQVAGTLSLLDTVTNNPISATFANVVATSDNTAAFSATSDGTSTANVIGIAAGTGNVTVTADCSYNDSTGAPQTKNLTFTTSVTVSAIITADAVSLVVTFGAPTQQ